MSLPDAPLIARPQAPDVPGLPPSLYDFSRPPSFSERHLRTTERVHEALADGLGRCLSTHLGEPVAARCTAVHEVQAVDFERSRALPTALFRTACAEGPVGVDVAPALALLLVERHLGGTDPLGEASRALSPLEQRVVQQHGLPLLLGAFATAWGVAAPAVDAFESHAGRLPLAPPAAPVVVADLRLGIGDGTALLTLAYPADTLHALLARQEASAPPARHPAGPLLDAMPLGVRAELGRTRLTVADLLHLAPGDVIPLDRTAEAPVPVWIGDRLHAAARAGASGARLALHLLTAPAPLSDTP